MPGVSFPADVDECDVPKLSQRCIALLAGIRADGLQPDRAFPNTDAFFAGHSVASDRQAGSQRELKNRPFTVAGAARA
jgi:hypothetical protein